MVKPVKPVKSASKWRVLAQDLAGRKVALEVEGTDFDELVVSPWFHLERLDDKNWWMGIQVPGSVFERICFNVCVSDDGKAVVTVTEGAEHLRGLK